MVRLLEDRDSAWINCDGLVKIYKSLDVEVMALQGLDLQIQKGEMLAIIGKSGSGKSTLMNMLGGLERPTAGRLFIGDEDLYAKSDREMVTYRKNQVGFVWQMTGKNLLPYLTAVENIEIPMYGTGMSKKEMRERALNLLTMVGLSHKEKAYPSQMSGGEAQRVGIAVALANEPELLLADEPTGAVDSKTSLEIQKLFRYLNEKLGITIIIVTHDMKLAQNVDRVLMIADGKISTEKIMKDEYRRTYESLGEMPGVDGATHEEYSVLDKAGRVQLSEEMLAMAGIDSKRVKVSIEGDQVIITKE